MRAKLVALLLGLLVLNLPTATLATAKLSPPPSDKPPVDLVVVIKSERIMYLYVDGLPVKSFPISLGGNPVGDKRRRGDGRTPVGAYILDWRNLDSKYYKSIHISYPNAQDIAWARAHGVDPGGMIMIHGQPKYADEILTGDWTAGCIAVSNRAMDILWRRVPMGTPIHIYP